MRDKQSESFHTMKYHQPLKKKGILTHAITRVNLEDIMLSEINRSQEDNIVWFSTDNQSHSNRK
jgi:hypothetical protein